MVLHCDTRRRKKTSKCGGNCDNLPDHLLIEFILRLLPLSCLFRCAAVCKAWRKLVYETHALYGGTTLTRNALFLRYYTFDSNSNSYRHGIRVITSTGDNDANNYNEAPIYISREYSPDWSQCDFINGFILYTSWHQMCKRKTRYNFFVCNPLTSKSIPLHPLVEDIEHSHYSFSMLVFDPALSHHYKVISFFNIHSKKTQHVYYVFSSEQAHLGWRKLKVNLSTPSNERDILKSSENQTVYLKGYAYRLGYKRSMLMNYPIYKGFVYGFNVKEESFEVIDTPPAPLYVVSTALNKAHNCLQYIQNIIRNVHIWRLEEDGRSWAIKHKVCLSDDLSYYHPHTSNIVPVHGYDHLLLYVGTNRLLYQYDAKQQKVEEYQLGSDATSFTIKSVEPFLCCAIDPEFRSKVCTKTTKVKALLSLSY